MSFLFLFLGDPQNGFGFTFGFHLKLSWFPEQKDEPPIRLRGEMYRGHLMNCEEKSGATAAIGLANGKVSTGMGQAHLYKFSHGKQQRASVLQKKVLRTCFFRRVPQIWIPPAPSPGPFQPTARLLGSFRPLPSFHRETSQHFHG